MRVKTFCLNWIGGTCGILAYAVIDLTANPGLRNETSITLKPDLRQTLDLAHWGGRLLHHGMTPLLILNAILIGGVLALGTSWVMEVIAKNRKKRSKCK